MPGPRDAPNESPEAKSLKIGKYPERPNSKGPNGQKAKFQKAEFPKGQMVQNAEFSKGLMGKWW